MLRGVVNKYHHFHERINRMLGRGSTPGVHTLSNFEKCRSIFSRPSSPSGQNNAKQIFFFLRILEWGRGSKVLKSVWVCMVCTLVKILIIVNDPKAHCHYVFLNSGVLEGINI